jgi:hypothetical protein
MEKMDNNTQKPLSIYHPDLQPLLAMSPQGRVIYKDGTNSVSAADEEKAQTLLTALKSGITNPPLSTSDIPATVLPITPSKIGTPQ